MDAFLIGFRSHWDFSPSHFDFKVKDRKTEYRQVGVNIPATRPNSSAARRE
jgi:hypothetical protein